MDKIDVVYLILAVIGFTIIRQISLNTFRILKGQAELVFKIKELLELLKNIRKNGF
jgi:hypothetical protein